MINREIKSYVLIILLPDCQLQQWAAVKLIFTLDSVGLGSGFILKAVLMREGWFCYCSDVLTQAFSVSHTTATVSGLGMHKELGGDTAGDMANRPKGYSKLYAMMFSIQKNRGGKGGKGKDLKHCCLPSQVTIRWWALFSQVWLNSCLPTWSSELIPCFSLLVCAVFLYLLNCLHYSSNSLPHSTGWGKNS